MGDLSWDYFSYRRAQYWASILEGNTRDDYPPLEKLVAFLHESNEQLFQTNLNGPRMTIQAAWVEYLIKTNTDGATQLLASCVSTLKGKSQSLWINVTSPSDIVNTLKNSPVAVLAISQWPIKTRQKLMEKIHANVQSEGIGFLAQWKQICPCGSFALHDEDFLEEVWPDNVSHFFADENTVLHDLFGKEGSEGPDNGTCLLYDYLIPPFPTAACFYPHKDTSVMNGFTMGEFKDFKEGSQRTFSNQKKMHLDFLLHATHASSVQGILQHDGLHFAPHRPTQYISNKKLCWFAFAPSEPLPRHSLFETDTKSFYGPIVFKLKKEAFTNIANRSLHKLGTRRYASEVCHAYVLSDDQLPDHVCVANSEGGDVIQPPSENFPTEWTCEWRDGASYQQWDLAVTANDDLVIPYDYLEEIAIVTHTTCVRGGNRPPCKSALTQYCNKSDEQLSRREKYEKLQEFVKSKCPTDYRDKIVNHTGLEY